MYHGTLLLFSFTHYPGFVVYIFRRDVKCRVCSIFRTAPSSKASELNRYCLQPFHFSPHNGGPGFKASLYPLTKCGQEAKVSVGESYLQVCFLCPLFHRETLPKKGLFLSEQVRSLSLFLEECCFYHSIYFCFSFFFKETETAV